MVINIGLAKAGDWAGLEADIRAVVEASGKAAVKVIIETCFLTEQEKVKACEAAARAGAAFVKTSTGFGTGGATPEDVALMKKAVGGKLKVKASGGIRSLADAKAMLEAGADRIGASAGVAIVGELPE
jgi:deoxyribose-phosphate aldolase